MALDIATVIGHCTGAPGEEPDHGSHRIAAPGCPLGKFLAGYEEWLGDRIGVHAPRWVVFEAPIMTSAKTSIDTARKLMCLAGITEKVAFERGVECREVGNPEVSKWFTGRGRYGDRAEKKAATIAVCRRLGFVPIDDNDADSLAIWCYASSILAPQVPQRRWNGPLLGVSAA